MRYKWHLVLATMAALTSILAAEDPYRELSAAWLQQAGKVRFVYKDWKPDSGTFPGMTTFRIGHRVQWSHTRVEQLSTSLQSITVLPAVSLLEITIDHEMRLPTGHAFTNRYFSNLVAHEYDHVRISTDFRPRQLLDQLLRYPGPIEVPAPGEGAINDATIREVVNLELHRRESAVVALISSNNELLDSLTGHGHKRLPDRPAFFRSLYTRERLQELNFPYLEQVEMVLRSPTYHPLGALGMRTSFTNSAPRSRQDQTISTGQGGMASRKALP